MKRDLFNLDPEPTGLDIGLLKTVKCLIEKRKEKVLLQKKKARVIVKLQYFYCPQMSK